MKSLILALGLLMNFSVFAQEGNANKGHPCMADQKKFCADVEKGEGRIIKCLIKHKKELSESCTAKMEEMKNRKGMGPNANMNKMHNMDKKEDTKKAKNEKKVKPKA